jgi:hypothetical protein
MQLGLDNIMFSVNWPYESNLKAVEFLKRQRLGAHDIWQRSRIATLKVFYVFEPPAPSPIGLKAIVRDGLPDS